ncbi:PP2C family serine/threonine-protein phosphatase [Streptomyces sp. NPDC001941]|uniref:PP2C family serine/threonine-protein phosphatase n=1 Tax=Streptomyces sp. NPDC001941 TaxID=3154659 RepID=UPI003329555E
MDQEGKGSWRVHGLSVEGYRHRRTGTPCQDAWQCAVSGPVTALAVADGAGSRPRSDEGSRLAADLAAERFAQRAARAARADPDGTAVQLTLREAFADVAREFRHRTGDVADDFATTLTVLVLAPDWLGHLSVGDGFVVLRAGSDGGRPQFHLLPQPDAVGEYGNETTFLTSYGAEHRLSVQCVRDPEVDGAFLSTDGLAQAALTRPGATPNDSFATAVLRSLDRGEILDEDPQLAALLRSDRLTALNGDDKTLLRAVRPGSGR